MIGKSKPDFGKYWHDKAGNKPINVNVHNFMVVAGKDPKSEAQISWETETGYLATICAQSRFIKKIAKDLHTSFVEIYADKSDEYYDTDGNHVIPFKLTKTQLEKYKSPYKKLGKARGFAKS